MRGRGGGGERYGEEEAPEEDAGRVLHQSEERRRLLELRLQPPGHGPAAPAMVRHSRRRDDAAAVRGRRCVCQGTNRTGEVEASVLGVILQRTQSQMRRDTQHGQQHSCEFLLLSVRNTLGGRSNHCPSAQVLVFHCGVHLLSEKIISSSSTNRREVHLDATGYAMLLHVLVALGFLLLVGSLAVGFLASRHKPPFARRPGRMVMASVTSGTIGFLVELLADEFKQSGRPVPMVTQSAPATLISNMIVFYLRLESVSWRSTASCSKRSAWVTLSPTQSVLADLDLGSSFSQTMFEPVERRSQQWRPARILKSLFCPPW